MEAYKIVALVEWGQNPSITQMGRSSTAEHRTVNPKVEGSNPSVSAIRVHRLTGKSTDF
tara:strand:- start:141 stop:317 length:177 start_codon:yes stop_codon:yes gene_type:complete